MVSTDYLFNHQVLDNVEHEKAVVTQLAHKLYGKCEDILLFEEELLSYISYLDFKNKSKHVALKILKMRIKKKIPNTIHNT